MRRGQSVLLVAAWGLPTTWRESVYHVRLEHPGLRSVEGSCLSCSSTLAAASILSQAGYDVDTLIFGLDSVVAPPEQESHRSRVRSEYERWTGELIEKCGCCGVLRKPRIEVLPSIGEFHGWRFAGSVDHLFVKAYYRILGAADNKWLVLDLTHGLNYQTVAVLYATVAAAVTLGIERKLVLLNSTPTPSPPKGRVCIGGARARPDEKPADLDMLDVTRLSTVIRTVRGLAQLENLDTNMVRAMLGELHGEDLEALGKLRDVVFPALSALKNGAAAFVFPGAFYDDGAPLPTARLCEVPDEIKLPEDVGFEPRTDAQTKTVTYPETKAHLVIPPAVKTIVSRVCKKLNAEDLVELLDKASTYLKQKGHIGAALQVKQEKQRLEGIAEYIARHCKPEAQTTTMICDSQTAELGVLAREKFALLERLYHHLTKANMDKTTLEHVLGGADKLEEELKKTIGELEAERKKNIGENALRNTTAHAGLELTLVDRLELQKKNSEIIIKRVIFDKKRTEPTLSMITNYKPAPAVAHAWAIAEHPPPQKKPLKPPENKENTTKPQEKGSESDKWN